jgi:hypothetical protein
MIQVEEQSPHVSMTRHMSPGAGAPVTAAELILRRITAHGTATGDMINEGKCAWNDAEGEGLISREQRTGYAAFQGL